MTDLIFHSLHNDLKTATKQNGHPFRYFTLATNDSQNIPHLRTVVLRDLDADLNFYVYTDKRSEKINHIKKNKKVSLLFLDQNRLIQLSVVASAQMITDPYTINRIWKQIPDRSKQDYTTQQAPGDTLTNPDDVDYLEGKHFFTALKITPIQIEYLRLKRPNHIRIQFQSSNKNWKGTFITP
ncbi:pyridoxamine 5'-phosphate oxidase family protein [Aquimarina sp. 2-A2]|uniref:pyridoxamine 5'-phosphate oxidase family protein n=1 Tax=Aquimarina sp. 2-A2 TaxID=3382644 RepID=UPI00387F2E07